MLCLLRENPVMSRLFFVITLTACLYLLPECHAGGDPFYYSTWYAQPSPSLAWSSQSVMLTPTTTVPGATNFVSPRFFYPGYGYVTPLAMFPGGLPDYGQTYSFGVRQPLLAPVGVLPGGSTVFQPTGPGNLQSGTLHQPWYLPGSPGNHRAFQYAW